MVVISFTASAVKSPAIFVPEQLLYRAPKLQDLQVPIPPDLNKLYALRSGSLKFNVRRFEGLLRLSDYSCYNSSSSIFEEEALIEAQDSHIDSVLFNAGVAEKWSRHAKIIKFLMSESDSMDLSPLSNVMGLKDCSLGMQPQPNNCNYQRLCLSDVETDDFRHLQNPEHVFVPEPDFGCLGDFSLASVSTMFPDHNMIFLNNGLEDTKDLLSVIAEFSVPKTTSSKQSMVVPYFTRRRGGHSKVNNQVSSSNLPAHVVSPLKSPDSTKLKPAHKKKHNRKVMNEQDLYHKTYFRACEILLSFVLDKNRDSMTLMSLKKLSPHISQLLTKFSASIAGIGLAVIFAVFFKVTHGRVTLCSSSLLNAGLGFGLFWVSSAVSNFRDAVTVISKNCNKEKLHQEELAVMVDQSLKELKFRAVTLVAVMVLRLA